MYKHCDATSDHISLHDCRAKQMSFEHDSLSFSFPDGFWVLPDHPANQSENLVRTDTARVDFPIIDAEFDGIEIYLFRKNRRGTIIREEWEPTNFINAVNAGDFQVEFLYPYQGYQSLLFKCWVWFDTAPWHAECEIILHTAGGKYCWNELNYDRTW